jgi:hypothetical protein
MQEILQRKQKEQREPVQQTGKIVEAVDLMHHDNHKMVRMAKLGSKLKETWTWARKGGGGESKFSYSSRQENSSSKANSLFGSPKSHQSRQRPPSISEDSSDERLWVKQTIEQENFKITKVLGAKKQTKAKQDSFPQKIETVTSGILSAVVPASHSSNSGKDRNDMEVVMAAEGDNPMFKVPDQRGSTPSPTQQPQDHQVHAILPPERNKERRRSLSPMKGIGKFANRLKQKELTTKLVSERTDKKKGTFPRSRSEGANQNQKKAILLHATSLMKPAEVSKNRLQIDAEDMTAPTGEGSSFCLSPSLTLENDFSLNRSVTDVAKIFAQKRIVNDRVNSFLAKEDKEGGKAGAENKVRDKAEAIREARLALMFSLKHRIINELKKQKLREHEAAMRGVVISKEEKAQQLETVRRLHVRREALQQLSDAEIREAFQESLHRKENEGSPDNGAKVSPKSEEGDDSRPQAAAPNRKSVSFAHQTKEQIIPKESMSEAADKKYAGENASEDEYDDYEHDSVQTGIISARSGIMGWANCGISAADLDVCTPTVDLRRNQRAPASKSLPLRDNSSAAASVTSKSTSHSATSRKVRVRVDRSPAQSLACGVPPVSEYDDDESLYSSGSDESMTGSGSEYEKSSRRGKSVKSHTLSNAMSHSGSLASYETRDTRDTRRTEYTADTKDSYGTRDTSTSYETRDSYYSYDTRDDSYYGARSGRGDRRNGGKSSRSHVSSVAGTDAMSEYTDDNYDEGLLGWLTRA